jgi:adenylate kinase
MAVNVVMLGPPGAGKGTQAKQLALERGIPWISTGDILREEVQSGTELGRIAKATMDAGLLVSDEVMIEIVRNRLARPDARGGVLLDGFPRTLEQARALDRCLDRRGPLLVFEIAVPAEEVVRRLGARRVCRVCGAISVAGPSPACERCGGELVRRSDDEPAVVRERLAVYERDTRPLVEYYQQRPTFRTIDGSAAPDAVARELRAATDALLAADAASRAAAGEAGTS